MNENLLSAFDDEHTPHGNDDTLVLTLDRRISRHSSNLDVPNEAWDMCFVLRLNDAIEGDVAERLEIGHIMSVSEISHDVKASEALTLQRCMNKVGLETREYLSVQNDEIYVLVRLPECILEYEAENNEMELECRPEMLEVYSREMKTRFPGASVENFNIPNFDLLKAENQATLNLLPPYEHICLPFKRDPRFTDLYVRHHKSAGKYTDDNARGDTYFTTTQRLKILYDLLQRPESDGGCGIDDAVSHAAGWSIFPLHTEQERDSLNKCWLQRKEIWLGWVQPLDRSFGLQYSLKDYFGEKVSLYFAFLGSHCRWLFVLGLLGLVVQIIIMAKNNPSHPIVAAFAVTVAIWCALFTQFWKRREAWLNLIWGMSTFEGHESIRLEFKQKNPKKKHDVVTGKLDYKYLGMKERCGRRFVSAGTTGLLLLIIMAIMMAVYWLKFRMLNSSSTFVREYATTIFSIILAVSISTINVSFTTVAEQICEYENHRTETSYWNSKVSKVFLVQMISSFGGLSYTAFYEHYFEGNCGIGVSCMTAISRLVAVILIERVFFTIIFDNVLPQINAAIRFRRETAGIDPSKFSPAETQFILDPYDIKREILDRYMDQVIMFGYMCLFACAFPVAPFLGYVSNILQIQQFGSSLLFRKQRNIPVSAQHIGSFQVCFEIVATLAILTNTGLIFFTDRKNYFGDDISQKLINRLFLGAIATIYVLVSIIKQWIPAIPERVKIQLRRQEFIKSRLFNEGISKGDNGREMTGDISRSPALYS